MDKDLSVAIFAPTTDEQGQSRDPKIGEIGTGYPIGPDLILTARHVVQPERRDPRHPLRIRWHCDFQRDRNVEWTELAEDSLLWTGKNELDAALLRCPMPESIRDRPWGAIVDRMPEEGSRWSSRGYARACRCTQAREFGDFGGTTHNMGDDPFFEIIEDAQPDQEADWRGASGMPVVVDGVIIGIVKAVPANFNAKKLFAVPVWRMLQNEKFHNYALPEAPLCEFDIYRNIIQRLSTKQGQKIFSVLKQLYCEKVDSTAANTEPADWLDRLFQAPRDQVGRFFNAAVEHRISVESADGVDMLRHLAGVWLLRLADSVQFGLPAYTRDPQAAPLAVTVVDDRKLGRVTVEGAVARNEQRPPALALRGEELRSKFDLTPKYRTHGTDDDGRLLERDLKTQIGAKTRPGLQAFTDADVREELEQHVTRKETGVDHPLPGDPEQQLEIFAYQLQLDTDNYGGNFYIRLPSADAASTGPFVRGLRERLPKFLVIEVSVQFDVGLMNTLSALHRVIYNAEKYLAGQPNPKDIPP